MNSNALNLRDFATITVDVERYKARSQICDSCGERKSRWLYVVKLIIYGIFHVCTPCKNELVTIADSRNTCFVKK